MDNRQTVNVFLSSKMGTTIGSQYHSYRSALACWLKKEYPFFNIKQFENTANPKHFRDWEYNTIRDCALFIGVIFIDSDEVINEIQKAIDYKNPILLFFFRGHSKAKKTWQKFSHTEGIKSAQPENWEKLLINLRDSIDDYIINLLNDGKGKLQIDPIEPLEPI